MNRWCEKEINEMILKISKLKSKEELRNVFDGILTPREINDMARRLKALEMLEEGHTYSDIQSRLGGFGFRRGRSTTIKKEPIGKEIKKSGIPYKGARSFKEIIK